MFLDHPRHLAQDVRNVLRVKSTVNYGVLLNRNSSRAVLLWHAIVRNGTRCINKVRCRRRYQPGLRLSSRAHSQHRRNGVFIPLACSIKVVSFACGCKNRTRIRTGTGTGTGTPIQTHKTRQSSRNCRPPTVLLSRYHVKPRLFYRRTPSLRPSRRFSLEKFLAGGVLSSS